MYTSSVPHIKHKYTKRLFIVYSIYVLNENCPDKFKQVINRIGSGVAKTIFLKSVP